MKKILWIGLGITALLLALLVVVYSFAEGNSTMTLVDLLRDVVWAFGDYARDFVTNMPTDLMQDNHYIILGGLGFGLVVGLVIFIIGIIRKRPLPHLISMLAVIEASFIAVSSIIPLSNYVGYPDLTKYVVEGYINAPSPDYGEAFAIIGLFGLAFVAMLIIALLGILPRKASKRIVLPSMPSFAPTPMVNASNPVGSTPTPTQSGDQLSELVKVVMQEELNAMKANQPGYGAVDPNVIRRIVSEELAKVQGQFISRAEALVMIAQEIAIIKAQLKIK